MPAIFYMNETSKNIVNCVRDLNRQSTLKGDGNIAAYSIDAGFHVFVFTLKDSLEQVQEGLSASPILSENIERFIVTSIDRDGV